MAGGGGGEQDLNLVPYMDIMINLIMFMIVLTAEIAEMHVAPVLGPGYKSGGAGSDSVEKPKPFLSVAVATKGIVIMGSSDEIPASELPASVDPKTGETVYPFEQMTVQLRALKEAHAVSENLVIAAEASVPYRVLVRTMDAARRDQTGDLFPGVSLGVAVAPR